MSYFTSIFPYIMLTVLVIFGGLLDGADLGVKYYIGKVDTSKFASAGAWKDAVSETV